MRCPECGREVIGARRSYCSDACARRARNRRFRHPEPAPAAGRASGLVVEVRARLSLDADDLPSFARARDVDGVDREVIELFEHDQQRWQPVPGCYRGRGRFFGAGPTE